MKKVSVIITAGGIGKRMGGNIPKQFLTIGNEPILMHTLRNFQSFDSTCELILALPEEWIPYWEELIQEYKFSIPHVIVTGGDERFYTVQKALAHCSHEIIAIHDAVRPFVSVLVLQKLWAQAKDGKNVIPVVDVKDSVRCIENKKSTAVDRSTLKLVQTPQVFSKIILQKAYEQAFEVSFTDDASVVERLGNEITLVEGNPENIKITHQLDLLLAESIYNLQQQ